MLSHSKCLVACLQENAVFVKSVGLEDLFYICSPGLHNFILIFARKCSAMFQRSSLVPSTGHVKINGTSWQFVQYNNSSDLHLGIHCHYHLLSFNIGYTFLACSSRKSSYQLQSKIERKIPAPSPDQTYSSSSSLTKGHLQPGQGATHHEGSSSTEVRFVFVLTC